MICRQMGIKYLEKLKSKFSFVTNFPPTVVVVVLVLQEQTCRHRKLCSGAQRYRK